MFNSTHFLAALHDMLNRRVVELAIEGVYDGGPSHRLLKVAISREIKLLRELIALYQRSVKCAQHSPEKGGDVKTLVIVDPVTGGDRSSR